MKTCFVHSHKYIAKMGSMIRTIISAEDTVKCFKNQCESTWQTEVLQGGMILFNSHRKERAPSLLVEHFCVGSGVDGMDGSCFTDCFAVSEASASLSLTLKSSFPPKTSPALQELVMPV